MNIDISHDNDDRFQSPFCGGTNATLSCLPRPATDDNALAEEDIDEAQALNNDLTKMAATSIQEKTTHIQPEDVRRVLDYLPQLVPKAIRKTDKITVPLWGGSQAI